MLVYELYHHGVKGMKWGVRKKTTTNAKTKKMYDRSNKWTERKIQKLDRKGKTAKAAVMREMQRRNQQALREKNKKIAKMSVEELKKQSKTDLKDTFLGGQLFMERNSNMMTNPISRLHEYNRQRGMRWMSNITLESTLRRMPASKGYEYLDRKYLYNLGVSAGSNRY